MIYTSYFAKLRSIPARIVPISICARAPDWYAGALYRKLAPTYNCLMQWKREHNCNRYVNCYRSEVLERLRVPDVIADLESLAGGKEFVLLCYEKPDDFCHRHLVAKWLQDGGAVVHEWN